MTCHLWMTSSMYLVSVFSCGSVASPSHIFGVVVITCRSARGDIEFYFSCFSKLESSLNTSEYVSHGPIFHIGLSKKKKRCKNELSPGVIPKHGNLIPILLKPLRQDPTPSSLGPASQHIQDFFKKNLPAAHWVLAETPAKRANRCKRYPVETRLKRLKQSFVLGTGNQHQKPLTKSCLIYIYVA